MIQNPMELENICHSICLPRQKTGHMHGLPFDMKNVGNNKCPILLTQHLFKIFLLLVITLVVIHNILGIYRIVFEPLDWLQYNVNSTPARFSGIFACHLEKWPPWSIHFFFMVAPYLVYTCAKFHASTYKPTILT